MSMDSDALFARFISNMETALPGIISAVGDGVVDVFPAIMKVTPEGVIDTGNKVIRSIPVMNSGNDACDIEYELKKGDPVLLIATSRDGGVWKNGTWEKAVVPRSSSGMTINDFVAIPFHFSAAGAKKTKIKLFQDGRIEMLGNVKIDGTLTVEKELDCKETIRAHKEITANDIIPGTGVNLSSHPHPAATGTTSPPTPGL